MLWPRPGRNYYYGDLKGMNRKHNHQFAEDEITIFYLSIRTNFVDPDQNTFQRLSFFVQILEKCGEELICPSIYGKHSSLGIDLREYAMCPIKETLAICGV